FSRGDKQLVDDLMIIFEQVEADDQALVLAAEQREVIVVLDVMVPLEMAQEVVETRRKEAVKLIRIGGAFAEFRGGRLEHTAQFAKHVVHLQPKLRRLAEIAVLIPSLARVFFPEIGNVRRQFANAI